MRLLYVGARRKILVHVVAQEMLIHRELKNSYQRICVLENQGENPFRVFCVMNVDFFGKKAKFRVHTSFELETSKYSFSVVLWASRIFTLQNAMLVRQKCLL